MWFPFLHFSFFMGAVFCHEGHHHEGHDHNKCEISAKSGTIKNMETDGVVPDVIDKLPTGTVRVLFKGKQVEFGNELTPTEVKDKPDVSWESEKDVYYTLSMVDPDAPSRQNHTFREVNHWLVTNILGNYISKADVITEFLSSGPPKETGLHRYVFLVFKQPKKLEFDEPRTAEFSREHRLKFSIKKFAQKYNLGDPVAGNFYKAQWDEYVEERNKKINN